MFEEKYLSGGGGGGKGEEGRAEQNSGPFEMVLNFEMRFEKKETFQRGGVAYMHLP